MDPEGGLEYALWNNWTLRAEYLFVNLGSNTVQSERFVGHELDCGTLQCNDVQRCTRRLELPVLKFHRQHRAPPSYPQIDRLAGDSRAVAASIHARTWLVVEPGSL